MRIKAKKVKFIFYQSSSFSGIWLIITNKFIATLDQQKDPSNSVNNLSLTSTGEELPDPPRLKPGRYIFISYASKDLVSVCWL